MSFIFGGNTGMTWEQAQAKRKLAEELARANMATPRNVGEGLNALGRALAFRGINRRAGEAEDRLRGEANAAFDAIFGGGGFGGTTTSTSGPGAGPVPSVVRPEAADAYRAMNGGGAGDSALPAALVRSESGGNFRAQNDVPGSGGVGHFGRGQFSIGRMQDAKNAGVIPASMTPEQFMASPDAQRAVEAWHVSDINGFIDGNGLARFEGQTIGGVPVTREGMLNVAHLGGNNGLRRFLETGGAYNPADANGTRLSDYLAMGAGGGRSAPVGPTVSTQGRTPGNMALIQQLAQLSANPALDPGRRAIVGMLLQQNMAAMQPQSEAERLDLEMKRLELERMRNPQPNPTERQRNYEYALSLGMTPEEARSFAGAGGTTINNNMGGGPEPIGTKGAVLVPDPTDPSGFRVEYAGNSEAERDALTASMAGEASVLQARQGLDLIDGIMQDPSLGAVTGMIEGRLPARTQAQQDLLVQIDQIRGKAFMAAFESLKGGGQITEKEGQAAEAAMARLNRAQSVEAYRAALQELRDVFAVALRRAEGGDAPSPAAAPVSDTPVAPAPQAAPSPAPIVPASPPPPQTQAIPEADVQRAMQGIIQSPNFDYEAWVQMPLEAQKRVIARWLEQNP